MAKQRKLSRRFFMVAATVVVGLVAWWLVTPSTPPTPVNHDALVVRAIMRYASAQEMVAAAARRGEESRYASSLPALFKLLQERINTEPDAEDRALMQADAGAHGADAQPYHGYVFHVIDRGEDVFPSVCAVPVNYVPGARTFVLDENYIIRAKDTQGIPMTDVVEVTATWMTAY